MLPIMLPIYKWWQVPYYYAGCKLYDVLAGKENMESGLLGGVYTGAEGSGDVSKVWVVEKCGNDGR